MLAVAMPSVASAHHDVRAKQTLPSKKALSKPAIRACLRQTAAQKRTEQRLRRVETLTLGLEHAREHALMRIQDRQIRCSPKKRSKVIRAHATGPPSQVGQWAAPFQVPVVSIHAIMLPTGKILSMGRKGTTATAAYLWDPSTHAGKRVDPPGNLFCAGQTLLADGRVLVVGGTLTSPGGVNPAPNYTGLNQVWIFNPYTETWKRQPDTLHGRWYPTATRLADGRVVMTSGYDEIGDELNSDIEVFTPSQSLTGIGTVTKVGTRVFTGAYPHLWLLPTGNLLLAGPGRVDTALLNPAGWTWTDQPDLIQAHAAYATGTLLPGSPAGSSKVMLMGGGSATAITASTEAYDAANPGAGWVAKAPLPQPRHNLNTVILPNGQLMTVGGNSATDNRGLPQHEGELYTPATNTWTPMASQAEDRTYHSTALLLPDGRVMSAGDDGPAGGGDSVDDIEIFSPPYLFQGTRPVIGSAPASISWGGAFQVSTPSTIARAVLIAPGAVTHANDMHQRHVELSFTPTSGGISAIAPPSSNVAPAGQYMLFLLDAAGTPSISTWVTLGPSGGTPPDTSTPTVTAHDPATNQATIATNADTVVDFSKPMAAGSVSASSFRLTPVAGGADIPATITASESDTRFTLDPSGPLAPGTAYRVSLTGAITDQGGRAVAAQSWTFTTVHQGAPFLESGGKVFIEAEHFDQSIARGGHAWSEVSDPPGFAGQRAMVAGPNSGGASTTNFATASPQLRFPVTFSTPGTYQVWVRGYGATGSDDTVHVGLDGAQVQTSDNMNLDPKYPGAFTWNNTTLDGPRATIGITAPGTHTIDVWMREDGFILDRVALITEPTFAPSADSQPESPRNDLADTTAPTLTARSPAPGATDAGVGANVVADFSEAINPATVTPTSFTLAPAAGGAALPATITAGQGNARFTLDPTANLSAGTQYRATITTSVTDVAGNPVAQTQTWTFTVASGLFLEQGGQVVVEAEDYDQSITRGGRTWTAINSPTGYAGPGAMQVLPNTGAGIDTNYATTAAQLRYPVYFSTPGTYRVWLRARADAGTDDTVHVGLDGQAVASAGRMLLESRAGYVWFSKTMDAPTATITVASAGTHTIDVWMREDGFIVDRVLLTTATTTPTANGPAESPRGAPPADTQPPTLTARTPAAGSTDAGAGANVVADFSEAINPATVTPTSFTLAPAAGGAALAATITAGQGNTRFTLDPTANLTAGVQYRATVTTAVTDVAGNALAAQQTWTFTTASGPFLEQTGQVVMEAEDYDQNITRGGRTWTAVTTPTGFVGAAAMQALPNTGAGIDTNYATTSAQLRYPVIFSTPGTYRVWLRARADAGTDDTVHVGLDGQAVTTSGRMLLESRSGYVWFSKTMDAPTATITVASAGTHTIDVWMREDGFIVDRVLLTTAATTPTGNGPAESPRG